MNEKKHRHHGHPADLAPATDAAPTAPPGPAPVAAPGEVSAEAPAAASELAEARDKYLRLAAEFENFKKRVARERTEAWARAQADLLARLVDALDDLARFAHVDPAQTDAKTIHDGVDMVERKIWKQLEPLGVSRIDQVGVPFDPHVHEAVTMQPAQDAAQDHTVAAVLQPGYKLGEALIRPARVIVLTWQGGAS
jgi:molecular chaperone GrpE